MRNKTIEIMKAISIMGIVLLHAIFIHYGYNTEWSTILRLVCIETLLVLSGYVIYGKVLQKGWLLEKIVRRLPLLLIWTLLYFLFYTFITGVDGGEKITANFGNYFIYNILSGFDGLVLWYVWQIVICTVVLYWFEKIVQKIKMPYLLVLAILIIVVAIIPLDILGLRYMKWYGLFMFIGYGLHYAVDKLAKIKWTAYISLVALPILVFLTFKYINWSGDWVNSGYINVYQAVANNDSLTLLLYIGVSLLGVAFIYSIATLINKIYAKPFVLIGGSTLGILLLHKWFLELKVIDNIWVATLISFIIALGISLMLKRVKILDYLLFGGSDIPNKLSEKLEVWHGKTQS